MFVFVFVFVFDLGSGFGFGFGFISAYITCLYSFYFYLAFVSVFPTGHCRLLFLRLVLPRFRNVLFSSAFGFAFAFDFDFGLGFRFAFGFGLGLGLGWVGLFKLNSSSESNLPEASSTDQSGQHLAGQSQVGRVNHPPIDGKPIVFTSWPPCQASGLSQRPAP